jgi:tripartite-type tricarboxylate transporter receptor subunit TctC
MQLAGRAFLQLGAAAIAASIPSMASAQTFPARPVRLLVGFGAGGLTDIFARLMGQSLSDRLGQQFIVENRTGAATNVATEAVVRAAPDGCREQLQHKPPQGWPWRPNITASCVKLEVRRGALFRPRSPV